MDKILITGGSGFIGTNLIERLSNTENFQILNLDIKKPINFKQINFWKKIYICKKDELLECFQSFQPTQVIHLAAKTDLQGVDLLEYKTNIEGVENVIHCSNKISSLERVIFASSMLVCKIGFNPKNDHEYCPPNLYGESKVIGEKKIRYLMKKNWVIIRPTSIWGPWFDVPYKNLFDSILKGYAFLPKSLKSSRSYGFVLNTVDQIITLQKIDIKNINKKTLYLCDYEPLKLDNFAKKIQKISKSRKIKYLNLKLFYILAFFGDFLKLLRINFFPITTFRLNNILTTSTFDTTFLKQICGPQKYDLDEAVSITLDWINQNHMNNKKK